MKHDTDYNKLKMDDSYIINEQLRFNNNTTQTFSQEKIIQKWTSKPQLRTVTTINNPRNKTRTAQVQKPRLKPNSVYIMNWNTNNWITTVTI